MNEAIALGLIESGTPRVSAFDGTFPIGTVTTSSLTTTSVQPYDINIVETDFNGVAAPSPVPEPSGRALLLALLGAMAVAMIRRRPSVSRSDP